MTMTREEELQQFAEKETKGLYLDKHNLIQMVKAGARWADSHPQWHDAQGDIMPEYGREVIVIRRNGEIGFGHRPNPKEYVVIEGKKCFAKTYDKNGWNWPDIALWLDVEIPHELIEQITDKWFEENEQKRDNE